MAYIYGSTTYAKLYNSSAKKYEVRVGYELISQSQEDNHSIVNAIMEVRTIDANYTTWGYKQTSTLGGIKSSAKTFSLKTKNEWKTFATQTLTLQHNEDGTYDGTINGSFTTNSDFQGALLSGSASVTPELPQIPRYSKIEEVTGEYLGSEITVTLSRELDTYKHKVEYSFEGSEYEAGGTDIDTSCTFTPSLELASQITDKTSGTLTIKVTTYLEGNALGELTSTITLKLPDNVTPKITNVTPIHVSNIVPSDWNVFVKSNSQVAFTIDAEGIYGSAIKSYSIVGANQSYSGESNTFTSEVLNTAGTFEFMVTVTDTRDRQSTMPLTITVLDYAKPSISALIKRCNADGTVNPSGTYLSVLANYSYSPIDGKNEITKSVTINGIINTEFESGKENIINANLSPSENYSVVFSIEDSLKYSSSVSYLSRKDTRVLNITKNKDGIAFNGFAEPNKFKNNYPTDFMQDYACPIGQVLITSIPKAPSIGTWELIDKEFAPTETTGTWSINDTNVTSGDVTVRRGGHTVDVRITFTNKKAFGETEMAMGTISVESLGFLLLPMEKRPPFVSDGGNACGELIIGSDGDIKCVDGSFYADNLPASSYSICHVTYVGGNIENMLDSCCNKFYWMRVADEVVELEQLEIPSIELVEETVEE